MTLCNTPLGHQMPLLGEQLIWGYTLSENMSWLQNLLLLHRGLFYKRPISEPVGFELSSYIHMQCSFGNHIYSLSSMNTYVFLLWQTYSIFCVYANNFGNCTHLCIMPMKCYVDSLKSFTFLKPYLLFHIYYPFSNPWLAVIFVFCKCLWSLDYNLLPLYFEIMHTCVYIQNTNAHEAFSWWPQIFAFVIYIYSFTSGIPSIFLAW